MNYKKSQGISIFFNQDSFDFSESFREVLRFKKNLREIVFRPRIRFISFGFNILFKKSVFILSAYQKYFIVAASSSIFLELTLYLFKFIFITIMTKVTQNQTV